MSGPQHPFPTGFPTAQQQAMRTQFGGGQMVPGLMGPQQPGMVSPQQFGVAGNPMGMPNPQQVMAQQQQQQQQLAVQQSVTMQMQQMQQQQQQMQLQQQVNLVPQTAQVQAVAQIQPGGQVQPVSQVQQQPQQTQQQQQPQTQSQQSQQAQPQQQSQPQQQQVQQQQQQTVQPGQNVQQQQQQQQQQQPGQSGQAGQPGQQQQQQQQQPNKEFNTVSLCKFGQETVQDLVSRTLEIFQTLKVFQPPNGTAQGANMANDKKSKVQEQLRMIKLLFRRLRLIYEKCNENCQLQGMEYTHIESLIPLKEEWDMKSEEKKTSEAYRIAFEDSKEATEQVIAKNRHLKEIIDHLRRIISEINTMLHMRRS